MTTKLNIDEDDENIIVYVVDKDIKDIKEQQEILKTRSLRLIHQESVEILLNRALELKEKGKLRTIGYPSTSKHIDYETKQAILQPRGFNGNVVSRSKDGNWYTIKNTNWKDGETSGFSGSPVLEFIPRMNGDIEAVAVGVLLNGSERVVRFLSINIVTNLIASYLKENNS
jgi:hypothetical protein